jgi:holin-like protein
MVLAFAVLLVFQLLGEIAAQGLGLPVPGPLVGMLLLFAVLLVRGGMPGPLRDTANLVLQHLMLLFIPAVTGVMMHFERVGREWLPFVGACVIGVILTMTMTALVLKAMLRGSKAPRE